MAETIQAVDLFAGAGGISWGLVMAVEDIQDEVELAAVNHWEKAIETHEMNHPWADHYHAKVEELNPTEVFEPPIDLITAGPECTHWSTARGGKPVDEQKRSSPWHVLDWVEKLRPSHFLLENVPEIESWGPVDEDGQPSRNGETFDAWANSLHSLGYSVDWEVLNAADYGDATTRERLFVIGRRNHRPEFPEPTHSENGEEPGTEKWRPAAEIIDWDDEGDSIWSRNRPLVNNTMQRIAEGIHRHGHDALEPYADVIAQLEKEDVEAMQGRAIPAEHAALAADILDEPFLVAPPEFEYEFSEEYAPGLADPFLLPQFSNASPIDVSERPVSTITTTSRGISLLRPNAFVLGQHGGGVARDPEKPLPTIASDGYIRLFRPDPFVLPRNGFHRGLHSNPAYDPSERPLHTITAKNHDGWVVRPYLVPFYGERPVQAPRTHDIDDPILTIPVSKVPAGIARPFLVEYYGNSGSQPIDEPLPTVTTKDRFALVIPDLYPWGLDVRFRMLKTGELAVAMGFPVDYEFAGNKTETVKQIGNAVPVNLSKALVKHLLVDESPSLFSDAPQAQPGVEAGGEAGD